MVDQLTLFAYNNYTAPADCKLLAAHETQTVTTVTDHVENNESAN